MQAYNNSAPEWNFCRTYESAVQLKLSQTLNILDKIEYFGKVKQAKLIMVIDVYTHIRTLIYHYKDGNFCK